MSNSIWICINVKFPLPLIVLCLIFHALKSHLFSHNYGLFNNIIQASHFEYDRHMKLSLTHMYIKSPYSISYAKSSKLLLNSFLITCVSEMRFLMTFTPLTFLHPINTVRMNKMSLFAQQVYNLQYLTPPKDSSWKAGWCHMSILYLPQTLKVPTWFSTTTCMLPRWVFSSFFHLFLFHVW